MCAGARYCRRSAALRITGNGTWQTVQCSFAVGTKVRDRATALGKNNEVMEPLDSLLTILVRDRSITEVLACLVDLDAGQQAVLVVGVAFAVPQATILEFTLLG
jgi:hypothetical protein